MRGLSHAGDRRRGRPRDVRPCPHFSVYYSRDDGEVPDPESVHVLSQGEGYGVGEERDEPLEGIFAVADYTVVLALEIVRIVQH